MTDVVIATEVGVRFAAGRGPWGRRDWLTAVEGVSFRLAAGEALGIVGESGCGKSTLGRAVLGLVRTHAGEVTLGGLRIDRARPAQLRRARRYAQMVFQDPQGSLDPRMTVGQSLAEPLEIFEPGLGARARAARVAQALQQVGLSPEYAGRYPHEFSGGQCQRIGIARAVILRPALVVCDEPVSALDVSVQGQVINLLADLRRELGLAYLFISHNLAVVRQLCDRVLVMYLGRPLEHAPRDAAYVRPLHPYTRMLLDAVPSLDRGSRPPGRTASEPPSPWQPPPGCLFHGRCPHAQEPCRRVRPPLEQVRPGHYVACHRWRDWQDGLGASPPAALAAAGTGQ